MYCNIHFNIISSLRFSILFGLPDPIFCRHCLFILWSEMHTFSNSCQRFIQTTRLEQSHPKKLQWPWCATPLHSLSNLSARRSHLLIVMSLKCDTFFTVVDQVHKHVPILFHHWDCRFEFRWDHKCTFAFPFLASMHEKLWNVGLNVSLCVRWGMSLRLPAHSSSITAKKGFQNKHYDVREI